jgi:hypothetical protein
LFFGGKEKGLYFSIIERNERAYQAAKNPVQILCTDRRVKPIPARTKLILRACSKSGILALQTPKFYLAGSKRARNRDFCGLLTVKIHKLNRLLMNLPARCN